MAEQTYLMNAKEVADVLDCSVDYAYKVIREMNEADIVLPQASMEEKYKRYSMQKLLVTK